MSYPLNSKRVQKPLVKSHLVKRISKSCKNIHPRDIEVAVKHVLDCMHQTLCSGGRIEIRGFGAFSLRYRPPRKAHNPKTGEKVATIGKHVLYFRPGKDFKGRLNAPAPATSTKKELIEETAEAV